MAKGGAFMKPVQPDEVLGEIVGHKAIPRTEIVKKIWVFIKNHDGVQEGRTIHLSENEKLQALAPKKKKITMFELATLLNDHICK